MYFILLFLDADIPIITKGFNVSTHSVVI